MSVGAGADEPEVRGVLAEQDEEIDVVGHAESAHEGVVQVLVETEVLVVGGQAVHSVRLDEDYAVYERTPASQVVHSFEVLLL